MRVYFAPCGIGLGHVGRTVPIAKELRLKKADIMFSTYREGVGYIENENLPVTRSPEIKMQVKPDGTIDFRRTAAKPGPFLAIFTLLKQINAEIEAIARFNPDIVVSDSRASSLLAASLLGIPRVCILNQFQIITPRRKHHLYLARLMDFISLTLIGKIWTSTTVVIIPDFPPPYTISRGNLSIPKAYQKHVKLIGPILEIHPDELPNKEELRRKLGFPSDKPLIFAAISGPTEEKAFLAETLKGILKDFPEGYDVVMSLGSPSTKNKPEHYNHTVIYDWLPNRFEYLKACDLVIGRSGHGTITQAMSYGKPMILVPTPNHTEQINNAKQAQDLGVAKVIPQKDLDRERVVATVKQLLESRNTERVSAIQRQVLKYDGLESAVKIMLEIAE